MSTLIFGIILFQQPLYTAIFILTYLTIGMLFFGYYASKYSLDGPDGLIPIFSIFIWPLFLFFKITIFVFSIPYKIGVMLRSVVKEGL